MSSPTSAAEPITASAATSSDAKFSASVVIPTYNRRDTLRDTLAACMKQTVPVEVIVLDDGSPDGTCEMVQQEFPSVRYTNCGPGNGPSVLRNRGIGMASCEICFPIDDDAVFVSPRTVEQTLADFRDPRIGAVAIPFINVRRDPLQTVHQRAAGDDLEVCLAYVGCAHAVRRDVFLAAGGYREHFYYMGEEGDVCLRMMARGYVTVNGRADPMHHLESVSRVLFRADYYGRRNDVLYTWHNVPMPYLLPHLAATTIKGALFGFKVHRRLNMLRGLAAGYAAIFGAERKPVSARLYKLSRELKRHPMPMREVASRLPAVAVPAPS